MYLKTSKKYLMREVGERELLEERGNDHLYVFAILSITVVIRICLGLLKTCHPFPTHE